MIRLGCAGIPLSCKGRTIRDAIEDIYILEQNDEKHFKDIILGAMEVQLVRYGVEKENLKEVKKLARKLNIKLSVHTPYYIDLAGSDAIVAKSMQHIKWSAEIAHMIGANIITTHLGLYGRQGKKKALEKVVVNIRKIRDSIKKKGFKCFIGIEPSGRQQVIGSLNEVLTICKRVKGTIPVLNFAHIHSRGNGCLLTKDDFQGVFDRVNETLKLKSYYTHFSGVSYENGNEINYLPIKRGDMKFEPLAECILDNNYDITIISGSPLLEHDAMYMKTKLAVIKERREAKRAKEREEANKKAKKK